MKKCILFTNCQGYGILRALLTVERFRQEYEFQEVPNYIPTAKEVIQKGIKEADLIIYQPTHNKERAIFITDELLQYRKPDAIVISFPYIYCNWLWPFYMNQTIVGKNHHATVFYDDGVIRQLYAAAGGVGSVVLKQYDNHQIDFGLKRRRDESLRILKEREATTDVKVADYILANYKTKLLFKIANHPTHYLLIHCANQILEKLGFTDCIIGEETDIGEYNDHKQWPIGEYAKIVLELEYPAHPSCGHFFKSLLSDVLSNLQESYPVNNPYFNYVLPPCER